MRRRTRVLAGVLALVAMASSFAEAVLASTCAPMAAMAEQAMDESESSAMDCPLMAGHEGVPETGGTGGHCPLGPAVGQGCFAAASLPVPAAHPLGLSDRGAPRPVVDDVRPDLLLAHALFHPPRA